MAALADLFDLYQFTSGRRVYAHSGVRDVAVALNRPEIVEHADIAIHYDLTVTIPLEHTWEETKNAKESGEAVKLDGRIDATLSAIHGSVKSLSKMEGLAIGEAARRVLTKVFPAGLPPIINLAHEHQNARLRHLLSLFDGDLASDVDTLQLGELLAQLKSDYQALDTVLRAEKERGLQWKRVLEAQSKGQNLLFETVALCIAAYPRADEEQSEKRGRLLSSILHQNDDIRAWRKRSPVPVDVDPHSGEVIVGGPVPVPADDDEPVEG